MRYELLRCSCYGFLSFFVLCLGMILAFSSLEAYLVFEKTLSRADAIVVMAGSPAERLPAAAYLFEQGIAPRIILANDGVLSAWSRDFQRNLFQVEWAEQELLKAGVPDHAIIKLPYTESGTYFDVNHILEYALANKIKRMVIVTSDYHTKRTYRLFNRMNKKSGMSFGVYPAQPNILKGDNPLIVLKRAKQLFVEFIKLTYYELKYGS